MFTGIIQTIATICAITQDAQANCVRMHIQTTLDFLQSVTIGDSIAIQGACMTVVEFDLNTAIFKVDVAKESMQTIVHYQLNQAVNLEKSVTLQHPLGGHLVSGHVDGIATLSQQIFDSKGCFMRIEVPQTLASYMVDKGSVTLNGVSLTVNKVMDECVEDELKTFIEIYLVPHTLVHTTLNDLKEGSKINIEIDTVARYLKRFLQFDLLSKLKAKTV